MYVSQWGIIQRVDGGQHKAFQHFGMASECGGKGQSKTPCTSYMPCFIIPVKNCSIAKFEDLPALLYINRPDTSRRQQRSIASVPHGHCFSALKTFL